MGPGTNPWAHAYRRTSILPGARILQSAGEAPRSADQEGDDEARACLRAQETLVVKVLRVASVAYVTQEARSRMERERTPVEECDCAPTDEERRTLWRPLSRRGALIAGGIGLAAIGTIATAGAFGQ